MRTTAGTLYWDSDGNAANGQTDGSGTWTGGTNWLSGANDVAWVSGNPIVFGVAGAVVGNSYTVTNTGTAYSAVQPASITFQGGSSYTLTGNSFNIQGNLIVAADVTSAQTISAAISFGTTGNTTATLSNNAVSSAGTINMTGSKMLPNSSASGGTLILTGTGTGTNLISAAVTQSGTGAVAVNVTGSRWNFTGANSYSGGTVVSGGTLNMGSATTMKLAAGALTIAGGTLSSSVATTTVGGNVVLSAGHLSLNDAAAGTLTLAVNQNFTMSGGEWDISLGTTYDSITGSGTGIFSITGGLLMLDVTGAGFSYTNTYDILNGFSNGSLTGLTIDGYDQENYLATLSDTGVLSFTAIPEANTWSLLMMGVGLFCVVRLFKDGRAKGLTEVLD